MDKTKLFLLTTCDNSFTDQAGKLSIIGMFDTIFADKYPASHPQLTIVSIWEGGEGKLKQMIKIKGPQNNSIYKSDWIDFEIKEKARAQVLFNLAGLVFAQEGEYKIEVYLNDEEKPAGDTKLRVRPTTN